MITDLYEPAITDSLLLSNTFATMAYNMNRKEKAFYPCRKLTGE
jgi:hypothetical protein